MRCIACDAPLSYKRKKPVTTFSGEMASHYNDSFQMLNKIPKGEVEDLCPRCISTISTYNYDQTNLPEGEMHSWTNETILPSEEYEDNNLSAEWEITEAVYQGFRDKGL